MLVICLMGRVFCHEYEIKRNRNGIKSAAATEVGTRHCAFQHSEYDDKSIRIAIIRNTAKKETRIYYYFTLCIRGREKSSRICNDAVFPLSLSVWPKNAKCRSVLNSLIRYVCWFSIEFGGFFPPSLYPSDVKSIRIETCHGCDEFDFDSICAPLNVSTKLSFYQWQ